MSQLGQYLVEPGFLLGIPGNDGKALQQLAGDFHQGLLELVMFRRFGQNPLQRRIQALQLLGAKAKNSSSDGEKVPSDMILLATSAAFQ